MSMDTWTSDAKQKAFIDAHNRDHAGDELGHWQEEDCTLCEERIDGEIESGKRCQHGELIPNLLNEDGEIETDLECPKCAEMELDKSVSRDIDFQKRGI